MAYSTAQMELVAHIEAENAATLAWIAEDPANRGAGIITTDPEHWAHYGVVSVDDYKRYMALATYSDVFKETYGYRPRHDMSAMTHVDIYAEIDQMIAAEQLQRELRIKDYRETVAKLTKELGVDEATLKRWKVV
jgi:hypothetical protein